MVEPALDFSRYAPARLKRAQAMTIAIVAEPVPALHAVAQAPADADSLAEVLAVTGFAARAFCRSLGIAASIMRRRLIGWVEDQFHRVMQSPLFAWSFAGVGWGGFIGACFLLQFAR